MSNVLVDTTWAADAPYTLTGATRSGGKLILDGNPAADQYATYTLAAADRPKFGSARGIAIAFHLTDFSMLTDTSGGLAPVIKLTGTGGDVVDVQTKTGRKLTSLGADSAALTLTTLYQIDGLYTYEAGGRMRLWIDGALSFDQRSVLKIDELVSIEHGLNGGLGKITYEFRFGHTKIWSQRDAT